MSCRFELFPIDRIQFPVACLYEDKLTGKPALVTPWPNTDIIPGDKYQLQSLIFKNKYESDD